MDDIVNYYANRFGTIRTKLNQKEIETLNKLSQEYSHEDLVKAIDSLTRRPKPIHLEGAINQILNTKSNHIKQEKQKEEEMKKEEKSQPSSLNNIPKDIPENYKQIIAQYKIPKNLIDLNLFSSLNKYLKKVYLSDIIAEYIYSKLSQDELTRYNKIANKHFSKMKLSEKEKKEAYKIYIKHLIKKELKIYV